MDKIVIFVSGSGTNMVNLVEKIRTGSIQAEPMLVISDKPQALALEKAQKLGVQVAVVDRKLYPNKEAFEKEVMKYVDAICPDWIILAGFMRILSDAFVMNYWGKIINIHPSLLPKFPGAHGIQDAFEAGVTETGATTHFVVPEVDAGPIILQKSVLLTEGETLESLEEKVHEIEYEIYPETLKLLTLRKVLPPAKPV